MLLDVRNLSKAMGAKYLFQDVTFSVTEGEKVALIGRNGEGKTTLLKILSNEDHEYDGTIDVKKTGRVILTKQEHIDEGTQTPLDYVLHSVPNYRKHKKILDEYEQEQTMDMNQYLHSVEYFNDHGYYYIDNTIENTLVDFGLTPEAVYQPLMNLSGGEKRYVEMTRMMFSDADLMLIDEPTNHMDYKGKDRFIAWMKKQKNAVVVVTHDRDVLKYVDRIIELKAKKIHIFNGNYDHYIKQNTSSTLTSVKQYTDQLNRLAEAKKKVEWGSRMKAKSQAWKTKYEHWLRDYEKLKAETVKPSFWIDQNSVEDLDEKVVASYDKFKEKNIKITIPTKKERGLELLRIRNLALGYSDALFHGVNFSMKTGDRVFIKGKNGAGKSTLVRTLLAMANDQEPKALVLDGQVELGVDLRIGEYEQEINHRYLDLSLEDAIRLSYTEQGLIVDGQHIKSMLAQYLFNPVLDAGQKIKNLSGGQKARFQLIKMFVNEPNLLILDEPTNHLDLPSIEELENALIKFEGGIIYISHDTYFIDRMGGTVVAL